MDKFVSHHVNIKFVGKEKTKQKMFHKIGFGSFSWIRDSHPEIPREGDN